MAARSASFRFLRSATGWCRVRSSSYWNRSSRRTSNRGRSDTDRKRTAHEAVDRVARAIVQRKTRVIDIDLRSYFDNVRHDRLLAKVAQRVDDADVMHLLKIMLKAGGKTRRSARRGDFAAAQQPLPHRGGQDAGAGEGGHALTASTPTSNTRDSPTTW